MKENNSQFLMQLTTSDFMELVKSVVNEELQKITNVINQKPKESEISDLLNRRETAKLLRVSETTLFLWNRDKILENKKIGNRVYYIRTEVLNKLKSVA